MYFLKLLTKIVLRQIFFDFMHTLSYMSVIRTIYIVTWNNFQVPALGACLYAAMSLHLFGHIQHQKYLRLNAIQKMRTEQVQYINLIKELMADIEEQRSLEDLQDDQLFEWYISRAANNSDCYILLHRKHFYYFKKMIVISSPR